MKTFIASSILTVAALVSTSEAFAGYVEVSNKTEHRLCFGSTNSFYAEGEGSGTVYLGWTCVERDGMFRVELDATEYVYISAVDEENQDFLAGRLSGYPSVSTYAPEASVDSFGVERVARLDGTWTYAYSIGDEPWSEDFVVADQAALETALAEKGIRKITGRVFRGADVTGGLRVVINF